MAPTPCLNAAATSSRWSTAAWRLVVWRRANSSDCCAWVVGRDSEAPDGRGGTVVQIDAVRGGERLAFGLQGLGVVVALGQAVSIADFARLPAGR